LSLHCPALVHPSHVPGRKSAVPFVVNSVQALREGVDLIIVAACRERQDLLRGDSLSARGAGASAAHFTAPGWLLMPIQKGRATALSRAAPEIFRSEEMMMAAASAGTPCGCFRKSFSSPFSRPLERVVGVADEIDRVLFVAGPFSVEVFKRLRRHCLILGHALAD